MYARMLFLHETLLVKELYPLVNFKISIISNVQILENIHRIIEVDPASSFVDMSVFVRII